ncbi:uncharacterized protein HD556DRAFT_1192160, partial [Suillus plorans]
QQSVLLEAIEHHCAALELRYPCHLDRLMSLDSTISLPLFEQQSVLSDLDEAVEFCWVALELRPPAH